MIWLLALALPVVGLLAYVAADACRNLARLVRDALSRVRQARADDPFDEHRCPICWDLADDEANGILRTDFELWQQELESTP